MIPEIGNDPTMVELSSITPADAGGAIIPELVKVFTSVESSHEGGSTPSAKAAFDILSGLVAGNFSAYWLGLTIVL
jgi:K(+)-stimulated pyrophosphate-energized sodium pump